MVDREDILRRLTLGDEDFLDSLIAGRRSRPPSARLSHQDEALVRLGALAATGGSDLSWQHTVGGALAAGLTADQVVEALVVLGPLIGSTQLVAITPKVSLALGYDVEAALEAPGPRPMVAR